jgi:hypothetical protein
LKVGGDNDDDDEEEEEEEEDDGGDMVMTMVLSHFPEDLISNGASRLSDRGDAPFLCVCRVAVPVRFCNTRVDQFVAADYRGGG